jgi:uncharacterized membrane protein YoaK (UPF0700 family)
MATDIGIELAIAFDILRARDQESDAAHNRSKLRLHLFTIFAFMLGGVVGVMFYRTVGGWLLILAAMMLSIIALLGIFHARRTAGVGGASVTQKNLTDLGSPEL